MEDPQQLVEPTKQMNDLEVPPFLEFSLWNMVDFRPQLWQFDWGYINQVGLEMGEFTSNFNDGLNRQNFGFNYQHFGLSNIIQNQQLLGENNLQIKLDG